MRLYPRAWRARYADEFVDVVGEKRLSMQQVVDIMAGAVDAWTSPAVLASVRGSVTSGSGGAEMVQLLKMKCATASPKMTTRDGLIGAGVILASTIVITAVAMAAKAQGSDKFAELLLGMSFPASLIIAMPFMYLKGQSRRVQALFVAIPLAILAGISWLSFLL
jgi:hypothetical protein